MIGVNPATESVETVAAILDGLDRLIDASAIPTQACCLAHITTQLACLERGAPVDLLFQSVAGTAGGQRQLRRHPRAAARRAGAGAASITAAATWPGSATRSCTSRPGQGSALSAEAHHGVDQLTLEARAYGVARAFDPFLVNSVVGFIGPEYLFDERQIIRAGLEDHFMGKLLGLPMGCDVCYTNHADADQNSADNLLLLLAAAGLQLLHGRALRRRRDAQLPVDQLPRRRGVRRLFGLRPAPEFLAWLEGRGIFRGGELALADASDLRQTHAEVWNRVLEGTRLTMQLARSDGKRRRGRATTTCGRCTPGLRPGAGPAHERRSRTSPSRCRSSASWPAG